MKLSVLIKNSIDVSGKTQVGWHKKGRKNKTLDMRKAGVKYDEEYSVHNNVICFVHRKRVFVTPFTRQRMATLDDAGFRPNNFYVPFSNGDYPVDKRKRWEQLMTEARLTNPLDYENECIRWADKHDIRPLKKETMRICFRIPSSGVPVEYSDRYESHSARIYPACKECVVDAGVLEKIGTFCQNNGRVAFVYRDGHTYVTRGHWIVEELRESGYKEDYLFVPFSRGEVITDPKLEKKWEKAYIGN